MTQICLTSCPPQDLASHLAMVGLGAILEEWCPAGTVRIHWSEGMNPRPLIDASGIDADDIANAVRRHAEAALPWLALQFPDESGKGRALLSPRRGLARDRRTLEAFLTARRAALDAASDALTVRFMGALGEPSFWHRDRTGKDQPDWGASRFDMQPRNTGAELVTNRLLPFAQEAAAVATTDLLDRLEGRVLVDQLGNGFTATGFAAGGPFDSVLAWCAFWGLSALPVSPRASEGGAPARSATSARTLHHCFIPMPVAPTRMARIRSLFADARVVDVKDDTTAGVLARRWLADRGAPLVAHFGFVNKGSANAAQWVADRASFVRTVSDAM